MHGNVFEWSFDKLDKNDSEGLKRMSRGGGWNHGAMPPLSRDLQNEQIENKPPVLHRWKLTFNLATIDGPCGKPPVLHLIFTHISK